MAKFDISFEKTMKFEGGYSNNPNDSGGETYKGISRKNFPSWEGWNIIDSIKPKKITVSSLKGKNIDDMVKVFYKEKFWDKIKGDGIINQLFANILFDSIVNMGIQRPVKFLQASLNELDSTNKLSEDGIYGDKTYNTLLKYLDSNEDEKLNQLIIKFNERRKAFYQKIVNNNPSQKVFLKGWLKRVEEGSKE
jgi:lysozyme family protein